MYVNGLDGQAVAVFDHNDPNNKRYYLLRDQVGSVRMAVKDDGQVMEYVNYHPFGEIAQSWASYDEPMKFTGHERDTFETMGYTYFGARYYDPELGQFTSIDKAAQFAGGFNYCGNNPIIGVDKDGNLAIWDDIIVAAVSATISFVSTYAATGDLAESFKQASISAASSVLAYNTGGAAAGTLFKNGSAMYSITASTVGGAVNGASNVFANQAFNGHAPNVYGGRGAHYRAV